MNDRKSTRPVIGLVGGVAAGKSAAAAEFEALGCARIDADAIGYEVLEDPEVRSQLQQRWGESVLTSAGPVDRKALGEIVFADSAELEALNKIVQPGITGQIETQIQCALDDKDIPGIVLDAAILFEAGWDRFCTHVLFVDAPADQRAQRAAERGMNEADWQRRENSQISLDSKSSRCYGKLDNSSSVSHLREQVRRMFHRLAYPAGCP